MAKKTQDLTTDTRDTLKGPREETGTASLMPQGVSNETALTTQSQDERPSAAYPSLAAALAAAQGTGRWVAKDGHNRHHGYRYATADTVIDVAREILADHGLALVPIQSQVDGWERTGENRFELKRKLLLLHDSGDSLECFVAWPIVPEKGRPLDKATAIADTASLAYFLRGLLLLPRGSEDDMDAQLPTAAPSVSVPMTVASSPTPTPAPRSMPPPVQPNGPATEPMTEEQRNTIEAHLADLKLTADQMASRLVQLGYPGLWTNLNRVQADDVIERLRAAHAAKVGAK